jgi:hypothetical protein
MARRVLALAFALLVAVTPVANGMCGVFCAEQHSGRADVPPHHHSSDVATEPSHHHHPATVEAPVSTATVVAVPHPCLELSSFVVESRDSLRSAAAATVLIITSLPLSVTQASSTSVADSRHGPPAPARSLAQLRI